MPIEVAMLGWAGLILVVQFALMAVAVNLQLGPGYTTGPRDERREPTGMAGRLYRAFNNMIEAVVFFTVAVVVITLGEAATPSTALAAQMFLAARIAYVPAYVSGVPMLRSAVWAVGFLATLYILAVALFM